MAKDQNTFAKRQREMEKRRKAEEKLERRKRRKEQPSKPETDMGDEPPTDPG